MYERVGPAPLGAGSPVFQRQAPWVDFFRLFLFLGIIKQFTNDFHQHERVSKTKLISPCTVTGGSWQPLISQAVFHCYPPWLHSPHCGGRRWAGQWLTEVPLGVAPRAHVSISFGEMSKPSGQDFRGQLYPTGRREESAWVSATEVKSWFHELHEKTGRPECLCTLISTSTHMDESPSWPRSQLNASFATRTTLHLAHFPPDSAHCLCPLLTSLLSDDGLKPILAPIVFSSFVFINRVTHR